MRFATEHFGFLHSVVIVQVIVYQTIIECKDSWTWINKGSAPLYSLTYKMICIATSSLIDVEHHLIADYASALSCQCLPPGSCIGHHTSVLWWHQPKQICCAWCWGVPIEHLIISQWELVYISYCMKFGHLCCNIGPLCDLVRYEASQPKLVHPSLQVFF